ncbi:TonB-dependent receptor [Paraglaciecola sp.]|uniref:TonB-dependent receptor n=1 Tax=Paraglaciecola sp. TaxID=1920173 RepID=UPI0030F46F3D
MKKSHKFKPAMLSFAVSTALITGLATAQETPAESDVEVIAVSGIRGSLIRAQAVKQENASIVEALSAEDIGKLPDSSIAESLSRLPGLSGERVGGRTSGISVRGFKEDFTGTSLNGRELIGIGDNRGVEYDLYPSEIMTGATIYKTTEADLMVQGIGGTVDLQTARPLQAQETLTLNGNYEISGSNADNPEFDNKGHRLSLSFVEKFADDTIGLAVALATSESPNNQRKYGVWGYSENDDGQILPTGLDIQAISTELKRDTISAILQFRPTDDLDIVVDALSIDYSDSGVIRGFIEPFNAVNVTGSGTSSTGMQVGANPVLRTDPAQKDGDLKIFGLNVEYNINDRWSVELDVANSKSTKRDLRGESYSGLARNGALDPAEFGTRNFEMSPDGISFSSSAGLDAFSDPAALQLAGPQEWGGGMANIASQFETEVLKANGSPYSFLNAQDGFLNYADFSEKLTTVKFEVVGVFDGDFFHTATAGVNFSDRYKDKENKGFFATAESYPLSTSIPSAYLYNGLADLTWAGLGMVVAYDGFAPYEDGTYTRNDAGLLEPDRLGDTYTVDEKVTTLYVKGDFETELGGFPVMGNIGVQYVRTDQSSTGYIGVVGANFAVCDSNSDDQIDADCLQQGGSKYNHILPSLNLSVEVGDNQFVRFAANKTISRARIDQMKVSSYVKFDQNIDLIATNNTIADVEEYGGPWSKFAGNPTLKPLESNNVDLSFENYFEDEGYVSLALFYKDLVNWTRDGDLTINFRNDETNDGADYFIAGFHDRIAVEAGSYKGGSAYEVGDLVTPPDYGTYSYFEDGLTGSVKGAELTANIPMNIISDALDGFGIAASATLINAELEDGSPIPGQSDRTYSLTAYYAMGGFEVRVAGTDRSGFTTYQRGGSNKIETATRNGVTLVDAQISYDFENSDVDYLAGLRVSLQGTNLTDVDEESVDDNGIVTLRRQFGPSYMMNFNYSFY